MIKVEVAMACPERPGTVSITALRVRWTLVWPSDAHTGPTAEIPDYTEVRLHAGMARAFVC